VPTLEEHVGAHTFDVTQLAVEHPQSAKTTTVTFEVISATETTVEEVIEETAEEPVFVNSPPMFTAPLPEIVDIYKTTEVEAWSLQLSRGVDLDPEDTVSLSVQLGPATTFMDFETDLTTLRIDDLSSDLLLIGSF